MSDERRGSHDSLGQYIGHMEEELAHLRQQLAEARAERDGFQCQLKAFDKLHWELVDLFDKEARGVSPLHYVKERIAAQAAELERLREAAAEAIRYLMTSPAHCDVDMAAKLRAALHPNHQEPSE